MAHNSLYLLPNSPLKTVFEVDSSPEQPGSDNLFVSAVDKVNWAPARLHRKAPSNGRRPRPSFSENRISDSPHALLHNDWYLNLLFEEVWNLYKPGAISGYTIASRASEPVERSASLLQILAPGSHFSPLRTHPCTLCEVPLSDEPVLQYATNREPELSPSLRFRHFDPILSIMPSKRKAGKGKAGDGETAAKIKRSNGRKDLLHDEKHVFSAKTKLANEDLTAIFANPEAWTILSEEEREKIRSLLPADMIYTAEGAPSPEFLRYDNDWRNGLRLFSEDVQSGRYEPEWLEAAEEAAEMRRRGDFDNWKEAQFEEHWGQKSDAHADLMAGEAVKIRLPEMIKAGLFKVGDVLSYTRTFGNGKNGFLVEKNSIIVIISGGLMNFTMAPGTLRNPARDALCTVPSSEVNETVAQSIEESSTPGLANGNASGITLTVQAPRRSASSEAKSTLRLSAPPADTSTKRSASLQSPSPPARPSMSNSHRNSSIEPEIAGTEKPANKKGFGSFFSSLRRSSTPVNPPKEAPAQRKPVAKMEIVPPTFLADDSDSLFSSLDGDEFPITPKKTPIGRKTDRRAGSQHEPKPLPLIDDALDMIRNQKQEPKTRVNGGQSSDVVMGGVEEMPVVLRPAPGPASLVTLEGVDSLHTLEQKILEVDGRRKGEPRANAWRTFRCKRGDEDLGTLWDMREQYYKRKHA